MQRMSFTHKAMRVVTLMMVAGASAMGAAACAAGPAVPVAATPVVPTATPSNASDVGSASASDSAPPSGGTAGTFPLACTSVSSGGSFVTPGPAEVSLAQISAAVGFQVDSAMPDTQSAMGFRGYEGCRYQFTTPSGGAQLDVSLVIGTDPTTMNNQTAAQDLADTKAQSMPRSERGCSGDCTWNVAATPGIGDSAYTLTETDGTTVVAVLRGDVYIEVGPGDLKLSRELSLVRVLLSNIR